MKNTLSLLLSLTLTTTFAQSVLYVNTNATGANNGSSWANARTNLSDALAAAQAGDEIWVAQGTYRPTRDSNHLPVSTRYATFRLKDSVKMYGGFTGTETQKAQRKHRQNPTILSGNINNLATDTDNVYSVVYAVGSLSRQTRLDGFTITKGYAGSFLAGPIWLRNPEACGGGIFARGSLKVTFINLIIEDNYATQAAGAYVKGTRADGYYQLTGTYTDDLYFVNCIFRYNNRFGFVWGATARISFAKVSFLNCLFIDTNATQFSFFIKNTLHLERGTFGRVINCNFLFDTTRVNTWPFYIEESIGMDDSDTLVLHNTIFGIISSWSNAVISVSNNYAYNYHHSQVDTIGAGPNKSIIAPYTNTNPPFYRTLRGEYGINKGDTALLPLDIYDFDEDGITNERIDFDLDNKPRVFNGQVDIGCYEYREHSADTTFQQMCIGDSVLWRGRYRTNPGVYAQYFYNSAALGDSVVRFALSHDSINTSITLSRWGNDLTSDEADSGSTYQWLKCFTDEPIFGATSRTFTPQENGNYKVVVTNSMGCIDTSECHVLSNIGLAEQKAQFSLYPNPVNRTLHINCERLLGFENAVVTVYNSRGELYWKRTYELPGRFTLNVTDLPSGMYILQIGADRVRFVKE